MQESCEPARGVNQAALRAAGALRNATATLHDYSFLNKTANTDP